MSGTLVWCARAMARITEEALGLGGVVLGLDLDFDLCECECECEFDVGECECGVCC